MKKTVSLILLGVFALSLSACGTIDPDAKDNEKLKPYSSGESNLSYVFGEQTGKFSDEIVSCSYSKSQDLFKVEIYMPGERAVNSFHGAALGVFLEVKGYGIPAVGQYFVAVDPDDATKKSPVHVVLPPTVIEKDHSFKLKGKADCKITFDREEKYQGHISCDSLVMKLTDEDPEQSVSISGDFTCNTIRFVN